MKTAILTDTNSGITVEAGREAGIYVLPMPVIMEEKCYYEGVDITNEQLYNAMMNQKSCPHHSLRREMLWLYGMKY